MAKSKRTVAQWNALSPAQRKRYVSAGRTGTLNGTRGLTPAQVRSYYLSGQSLSSARGKHTPAPAKKNAPPRAALNAAARGEATTAQLKQLRTWQTKKAPKWVKDAKFLSEDTSAILASVGLAPQNWKDVKILPLSDGRYAIEITSKRGGPMRKIILPDEATVREMITLVEKNNNKGIESRGVDFKTTSVFRGYRNVPEPTEIESPAPKTKRGNALPRKAKK